MATSSEELNSQAETLIQIVDFFKIGNNDNFGRPKQRKEPVRKQYTGKAAVQHQADATEKRRVEINLEKYSKNDSDFETFWPIINFMHKKP